MKNHAYKNTSDYKEERAELFKKLEESEKSVAEGKVRDGEQVLKELKEKVLAKLSTRS